MSRYGSGLGLRYNERRRRRRTFWNAVKVGLIIGVPLGAFGVGYSLGESVQAILMRDQDDQIASLKAQVDRLHGERAALAQQLADMQTDAAALQQRYQTDVPAGERSALLRLVDEQLALGVTRERLAMFIASASALRDCEEPSTKAIELQTQLTSGGAASFADGTITVSGSGETARDEAGNPEAWFDASLPVALTFAVLGGEPSEAAGTLPLEHALLANGAEFRFAVRAVDDRRGYVEVTGTRCQ